MSSAQGGVGTPAAFNPFSNPMFDPTGLMQAWASEMQAAAQRLSAMPKVLDAALAARKGCTPHTVVQSDGTARLIRYESTAERRHATPVLFVFALVNRPYVLDLLPHKSVVRQFLNAGFDVWMIDWGVPTAGDRSKTIADYVEGHLHRAVQRVLSETAQSQLNIVGYCMGGTLSSMYTSFHQDLVKNLVLMAAPIEWGRDRTLLMEWTDPKYFDVDKLVDALGMIPPQFLGSSFSMLKPVANYFQKWQTFFEKMDDDKFLEDFFAMEVWSNDNIPISGEVYRDFVKFGFQQNLLVQGKFPVGGRRVDLANISCPVLTLTADADHLVLPCQSTPIASVVSSKDVSEMRVKAGHIGLAVGAKAHKELWPAACKWLGERSEPVA